MDTELASAAAITKAVNKPSMGSAKFATHVGISEGKVASGARKHGGWVSRLVQHPGVAVIFGPAAPNHPCLYPQFMLFTGAAAPQ
jgi:hypothetical protein